MAQVIKLNFKQRIKKADAELVKRQVDLLDIPEEARAELDNALYKITNTNSRRWCFVMISPEQFRIVTKAVQNCRNVAITHMVWTTAITYIRMDTGEIMADREQIAEDVDTTVQEVSRAMTELTKIGAVYKQKRGRKTAYFVNPNIGWAGGEGSRLAAAEGVPKLRLVAGGLVEPSGPLPTLEPTTTLIGRAVAYLRSLSIVERRQWADRAIANGAPALEGMTNKKIIPKWAGWVLFDLDHNGRLTRNQSEHNDD